MYDGFISYSHAGIGTLESASTVGHSRRMTTSEARRHDLYNALSETLGADKADTLMAYLPSTEAGELTTRADLAIVREDIEAVRSDVGSLGVRIEALGQRIEAVNQRLDRLFLTLAAGLIAMVGALFVQSVL